VEIRRARRSVFIAEHSNGFGDQSQSRGAKLGRKIA